ncbi:MAG: MATE family efflux transporter, partial [Firmicutes bacterium]|nr:MATE family efflux transporter [Bacillota bacterium]
MQNMNQNKMAVMPIPKLLFSMSLPAMFSMLIMAMYNIIDSMFVSRLGEDALTAVTLVFPIQMLLVAVSVGTGVGLSSLISRRLGQQRQKETDSAASHGIFLAFCSWLVF